MVAPDSADRPRIQRSECADERALARAAVFGAGAGGDAALALAARSTMDREHANPNDKQTNAKLLEIIVGTSIKRRPILEYRWTVPVVRPQ